MSNNNVVKILIDDDGEEKQNPKWCLVDPCNYQGRATLCTSEFFGFGESGAVFETKSGKITCEHCIEKLKRYKSIKL